MCKSNDRMIVSVDAEWCKRRDENNLEVECHLTTQLLIQIPGHGERLFVYYNPRYIDIFEANISWYMRDFYETMPNGTPTPKFIPMAVNNETFLFEDLMTRIISELDVGEDAFQSVQINFFFSLRDLYYLFSESYISQFFSSNFKDKIGWITGKNAIFGKILSRCGRRITLQDYSGLSKSFAGLLSLLNIDHPLKESINKLDMERELVENFKSFLNYAILDVVTLARCEKKILSKIKHISQNILGLSTKPRSNYEKDPCTNIIFTNRGS